MLFFIGTEGLLSQVNTTDAIHDTKIQNDSLQNKSLETLFKVYEKGSFQEAEQIIQNELKIAKIENDTNKIANTLYHLGVILQNHGDNQKAFASFLDSYNKFKTLNNDLGMAFTMDHLGSIYRYYGRYEKSLEFHTMAYDILKHKDIPHYTISVLLNLGKINRQVGNTEDALSYNKLALSLATKTNSSYLSSIYVTLGSFYWYQQKNDSAYHYYKKALNIEPLSLDQKERHCAALNNIGNVYRSMKQYDSAFYYYELALDESRLYQTMNLEAIVLKNMGETFLAQGLFNKSNDSFTQSLKIASKINLKKTMLANHLWLSELHRRQNDYKKAFNSYKAYSTIKDSIFSENQSIEISKLQSDFLTEKEAKEQAIALQKNAEQLLILRKKENLNNIFLGSIILLVASISFIFTLYKTKIKSNQNLKALNEELEHKVKERTKSLEKAKDKAEESDRLKTAFLSNMSHEIRTPMNSIIGFSDLLEEETNLEKKKRYVKIIQKNGDQLLNLIDDIIDIAKIEANEIKIKKTKFSLNELMEEVYKNYQFKTNLKIDFKILIPNNQIMINTDYNRLLQILKNILNNAFKFTEQGRIEFGFTVSDNLINFFVKDTGIGISEQSLKLIFERFRRATTNNDKIYDGTGLGLAITKNLVNLLGGKIYVESTIEKGSTFKFNLPIN